MQANLASSRAMSFGLAAKCQSGIIDLGMKPKVEYLNMAKKFPMVQNLLWLIHYTEIKRWQAEEMKR